MFEGDVKRNDESDAMKMLRQAVEQRSACTTFNLGVDARQVDKDRKTRTVKLLRGGCVKGGADANFSVGVMCEKESEVSRIVTGKEYLNASTEILTA